MLRVLSGFPDNVLAIEGYGEVTAADYKTLLVPVALAKMKTHQNLRFFYHLGSEFTRLSAGAIWEDVKLGVGHWRDWGRIAVVTDVLWVKDAVRLFAPLFHHPIHAFNNNELRNAKTWICANLSNAA